MEKLHTDLLSHFPGVESKLRNFGHRVTGVDFNLVSASGEAHSFHLGLEKAEEALGVISELTLHRQSNEGLQAPLVFGASGWEGEYKAIVRFHVTPEILAEFKTKRPA